MEAMIDGRLRRQEILHDPHKRIQVVLGEAALRTLVCTPETLAGQLSKLLSVIRLPALELGIIGFSQPMPVFPFTAFSVRDDDLIVIERLTGEQYLRAEERPEEVASFLKFLTCCARPPAPGQRQRRSSSAPLKACGRPADLKFVADRLAGAERMLVNPGNAGAIPEPNTANFNQRWSTLTVQVSGGVAASGAVHRAYCLDLGEVVKHRR